MDYVKGCAPFTVSVIRNYDDESPDHTRVLILHDSNGNPIGDWTNANSITINSPGTYYLVQDIQTGTRSYPKDSIKIVALSPDPVPFTIANCGNNSAGIELIPEENTYTAFKLIALRPGETGTPEVSFQIEPNPQGQYKATIPFNEPGEYDITIKGLITEPDPGATFESCRDTTFRFTVHGELAPAVLNQLQASIYTEGDSAVLTHELLADAGYILEVAENGNDNFQPVQAISGPKTNPSQFIQFDFENNFYCFRASINNPCSSDPGTPPSESICTAKLQASPQPDGNRIEYTTATAANLEEALLFRKTESEIRWQQIHSFGSATTESYLDSDIDCNTAFQYAIELVYANGSRSFTQGLPLQNETSRSLPAPLNISSSWQSPSEVFFSVAALLNKENIRLKAYSANNGNQLVNEADTAFVNLPAAGTNTCYRFGYTDACGNSSELSEAVCAIFLQNLSTEPDGLILQWNAYTGYVDGVARYELVKYDRDGTPERRTDLGTQISIDLGTQELSESGKYYEIVAYPADIAIPPSSSNRFLFEIKMKGYFANVFNPTSEGANGKFTAQGKFVEQLHLQIFNRWGERVYETRDKETGWDGKIRGNPAPSGTYMYRAVVTLADGQQQTYQGAVFLLQR